MMAIGVVTIGAIAVTLIEAPMAGAATGTRIVAVGAENQYADVISQIGGRYVTTTAVLSNPNTDPHTFESSPRVAEEVSSAALIVQNGVGYDEFMNKIESASGNSRRKVIDVQHLLGLPDSTPNPHLWPRPSGRTSRPWRRPTPPTSGPTCGASGHRSTRGTGPSPP
jgi:zinc/manganese transport system substrate-binding protein